MHPHFSAPPPGRRRRPGGAAGLTSLLLAATLGGCAMPELPRFRLAEPAAPAAAPAPVAALPTSRAADPLGAFLANAAPGSSAEVPGYGSVRLGRSYAAASGRDCREAVLGRGVEERAVVYCQGPQGWAAARPLLRAGTMNSPLGAPPAPPPGVARP